MSSGAAASQGVQLTALVAMLFVATAIVIYFFNNGNEVSAVLGCGKEE